MKCVFCGTDNPDGALFCKKCGKRLDGMTTCPSCGKDTPADGDFCIYCGAGLKSAAAKSAGPGGPAAERTDGKFYAYPAADTREGAPSARVYGSVNEPLREAAATAYVAPAEGRSPSVSETVKKALKVATEAFAVLAALIGMIFVFFIGNEVSADASGAIVGLGGGCDIFYFFGDAYKDIESALESSGLGNRNFVNYSYTTAAAVGTVCSALALAATVILFIATVVRCVRKLLKLTQKSVTGLAAATFFSYVCGVALFMLCASGSISAVGEEFSVTVNEATVAGLVLGGVFIVASAVSAVACGIDKENVKQTGINGVFGAVATVFLLVIAGVAAYGVFGVAVDAGYSGDIGVRLGMTELFNMFASLSLSYYAGNANTGAEWNAFVNMYNSELVVNVILLIFAIAFCIFAVISLSGIFSGFGKKMGGRGVKSLMASGICAVITGIMMIITDVLFINWVAEYGTGAECGVDVAVPVVVMLFGLLLVVCACIYYAFLRREEEQRYYENYQQPPRYDGGY